MSRETGQKVSDFLRENRDLIGRTKFYSEVRAGKIKLRKLGRSSIITAEDREAWLRSLPMIGGEART